MRTTLLLSVVAAAAILLLASPAVADGLVVWSDGSPVAGAKVVCIQSCWAQVPDEAPRLLETSDRGELVLQPAHAVPLLVLDGLSGDTVISGTGRWLDPRVPAELATFEWTATGGRLDLGIVERTDVRLAAPGYRAVTLVLEAAEARRTVLLQPIAALELSVEPPVDGSLVLWPLDKVTPFSMLSEISQTHDLKAGESLAIDLGPGTTWLGAAIPREHAPIPLTIKALPARLELHLEPGLRVVGTVQDPDRAPISGSHVVAGGVLPEPHQVRYTQEATTDENGRFEILGLVAGEISLQACASGRSCHRWTMELDSESAPEPQEVVLQPGFDLELHLVDRDGLALEGVNITASDLHVTSDDHGKVRIPGVSTGQKLELAARGGSVVPWQGLVRVEGSPQVLELERGASLTWAILVPEGMASEDTAGNGISVMWERSRPADNQPLDNGTGRWDNASGQAVADGLRPGLIRMKVDIPGLATLHSEPVELQVGEAVMLPPAVPDAGRVIAGRVVSAATGELIAGAQLRLEQGDPTSFRPPGLRESARSAVSDEDGSFRVSGLGEGPYRVRAVAPGFAPTVRDGIEPGSTMDTIELGEGLSIEGVVVDRQGEPLGGSRVEVWETAPYAYEPETSSVADDNGAFALEHLPVGTWRLEVGAGGRTARKEVTGGEGEALDVELRLGGVRVDGVVLLGDTPAGPGTLVLQPPGARTGPVVVLRRGSTERFFGVPGQSLKAAVDGRGEFELTTVDPGRWIARFTPAAGGAPGADVELQIPDVEQHTCVVQLPGGTLRGTVVDGDDQPVGGARVDLDVGSSSRLAFADSQGAFLFTGVASGQVRVTASGAGYSSSDPVLAEVPDGGAAEQVTLVLRSETGGTVRAEVLSASGSVGGASASLLGPGGGGRFLAPDGTATWTHLDPGSYRLCARAYGGPVGCTEPVRVEDDTVVLRLDLGRGGYVSAPLPGDGSERPVPRLALTDGTDLTGLAFLGNPPRVDETSVLLGPFASGEYSVQVAAAGVQISGLVKVRDGEVVELQR